MAYDFSQLNDKEFEALVADLLSVYFDKRIERFKSGKDGGVDGRFYSDPDNESILQCKHYLKTGYKGLISKLKNDEAKKVTKLSPDEYIFVTSLPLSRKNKTEIKEIFSPYLKREDDIFGQEDLNVILSNNPNIEEKYFKLWITSTNVFDRIINNAIKGRSESILESAKYKSKLFVTTQNFKEAIDKLEDDHVLIITGEPGIGKTTLAENICLRYVKNGFNFLKIEESVSEAENVYKPEEKQIFYFDDFLGSNYLEAIEYKKDSHIVNFIERVNRDNSKRLILTSRTNILNSGIQHSPIFVDKKIDKNEYLLKIESLSEYDKAQILYNHIWHGNLMDDFISELYVDKRYHKIIKHRNYSPRIIQFITDNDRISIDDSSKYWDYILDTLNNPSDIWNQCFKRQNNEQTRNLVSAVVFNSGSMGENQLRDTFNSLNQLEGLANQSHSVKDFDSISEISVKTFLNRTITKNSVRYTLFNPSLGDYVINDYSNKPDKIKKIFASLNTLESLKNLSDLFIGDIINPRFKEEIYQYVFEQSFKDFQHLDYKIKLAYQVREYAWAQDYIINLLNYFLENKSEIDQEEYLFYLLDEYFDEINDMTEEKVFDLTVWYESWNDQDIVSYALFIHHRFHNCNSLKDILEEALIFFMQSGVNDQISELDLGDFVVYDNYGYDFKNERDIEFNVTVAKKKLLEILYKDFEFLFSEIPQFENIYVDFHEIADTVDLEQLLSDYDRDRVHEDEGLDGWHSSSREHGRSIDDLFERT
jgi:hypothetical protein